MKKILFTLFLIVSLGAYSQEDKPYLTYCEIVGTGSFSGHDINISIDFGANGFFYRSNKDNSLVDENGNPIEFSSMIETLNYMAKRGWSLDVAYSSAVKGMGAKETYRYILKKEITNPRDVLSGLKVLDPK